MKTRDELIDLLNIIDSKARYKIDENTMTELDKLTKKAIEKIESFKPDCISINELKESIKLSDNFHKQRTTNEIDNIMLVLRSTKFAIESFLHKEFGIEI